MSAELNVAAHLREQARARPEQAALITPQRASWLRTTYAELEGERARSAAALTAAGIARGDRVVVFVQPGVAWVALVYALFAIGAIPVLIDPGMGLAGVLACVERIRPRGLVGVARAHLARLLFRRAFASVEVALSAADLRARRGSPGTRELAATCASDVAAILFTSGSTGPAKGVVYTHGMFDAQLAALRAMYAMRPGDVDLACFAPFALFGPALGLTTVLPHLDFSHPARCEPADIVRALADHAAVQSFGSPAIWSRVAPWCAERGVKLASLRRLMIAGAPVSPSLIEQCLAVLPKDGDVYTPYGATEALPVSSASGRALVARAKTPEQRGAGNCVGRLAPGIEARVIRITDAPIARWSEALTVARGEAGELAVRGPNVTREYAFEPEHTAAAKIQDGDAVWHRMGDVVRIDGEGELWFLGRKSHRVETAGGALFPVGVENVFDLHPAVHKSALVGVGARGAERPWLIVVPKPEVWPSRKRARDELAGLILASGASQPACARVEGVLFRRDFPVDVRHNAKIDRTALKRWAQARVR